MPSQRLEAIVKELESLTPDELKELLELLQAKLASYITSPEERLKQRLLDSGLMSNYQTSLPTKSIEGFQPVHVEGIPISETIIKERR
jgi:hypothetical protein